MTSSINSAVASATASTSSSFRLTAALIATSNSPAKVRPAASAVQAAQPPEPPPQVDIARRRHIFVHLTPFCPGRERLAITHAKRNKWFYSAPPLGVLKTVLAELRVMPAAAGGEIEGGDLVVTIPVRPELAGLLSGDDTTRAPGALISDGLTLAEFEAARAALIAANWKPPTALELVG